MLPSDMRVADSERNTVASGRRGHTDERRNCKRPVEAVPVSRPCRHAAPTVQQRQPEVAEAALPQTDLN